MKKILCVLLGALLFTSVFAADKKGILRCPETISEEIPDSELAEVTFKSSVVVVAIDGVENKSESVANFLKKFNVDAQNEDDDTVYLDEYFSKFKKERTALFTPGVHVFTVKYNNGKAFTFSANTLRYNLEAGKSYKIISKTEKDKVVFDIVDGKTGKSLTNPNNYNIHQKSVLAYVENVLGAVEAGKKVTLRRGEMECWEYGPDLTVKFSERGQPDHKGYIGFSTDKDLQKATVYIKFDDEGTLTKDEFLALKPEKCDRVYELIELSGTTYEFKSKTPKKKDNVLMDVYIK